MMKQRKQIGKQQSQPKSEDKESKNKFVKKLPNKLKLTKKLTPSQKTVGLQTPKLLDAQNESKKFEKEDIDNLLEATADFMDQVQNEVESMYDLSKIEFSPPVKADKGTVFRICNLSKRKVTFIIKITGVGNAFFERIDLQKGEERELHLEQGAYQIEYSVKNHYINKGGSVAPGEDWLYKRRVDGTNVIQSLVEFGPGNYYLGIKGQMSAKEFKKLLKDLEKAPTCQ